MSPQAACAIAHEQRKHLRANGADDNLTGRARTYEHDNDRERERQRRAANRSKLQELTDNDESR